LGVGAAAPCPQLRFVSWHKGLDFAAIEHRMATESVVRVENMNDYLQSVGKKVTGIHLTFLLTLSSGLRVVVKPRALSAIAETAAYRAGLLVGSRIVPPTIRRLFLLEEVHDRRLAAEMSSVQLYVESPYDLPSFSRQRREALWGKVPAEEKAERVLFAFVFGQWDLHWGNIIMDEAYSLALIENENIRGRLQVQYGSLPFLRALPFRNDLPRLADERRFPFENARRLQNPTKSDLLQVLAGRVSEATFENFWIWHYAKPDLTMATVAWDHALWIQRIGFGNHGPLLLECLPSETVLQGYKNLNIPKLRSVFAAENFSDVMLQEILERRDQVMEVADSLKTLHTTGALRPESFAGTPTIPCR
jgi:hypothetical protein